MGDATGKIGQIFETLAEKEEKMLDLERKVTGALIYPMAIVVVAVTMVCILLIYVIPRIEAIYKEAHTSLPPLTTFVISISHGLRDFGIWIVLALIGIVTLIQILLRKPDIRMSLDRAVLHLPIFGPMLQQKNLVIFSDFLSILLASGVTIHRALEIVAQGMENFHYKRAVGLLIRDIRQGKYLSLAMGGDYLEQKIAGTIDTSSATSISKEQLWTFTMELSTAVKVGEQTGKLSHMLEKASKRYEKDIDTTVRSLSALLEPIVIIVIGAIVGVIVLAIMMPFFNMVKVIG